MVTQNSKTTSTLNPNFELHTTKQSISNLLRENEVTVTFTKKDGTERVMRCTLMEDVVPSYDKTTDRTKEPNPNILPVWDVEADAWRSILITNIISIEV